MYAFSHNWKKHRGAYANLCLLFLYFRATHEHANQHREEMRTGPNASLANLRQESAKALSILGSNVQVIGNPHDQGVMSSTGRLSL